MSTLAPLTQAEVTQLVAEWYRGLDVHAPSVELVQLVAEEGLEMVFPEATVRGLAEFDHWYNFAILRTYFDEVHTLKQVEVALNTDQTQADARIVVIWEASRWPSPAPHSERLVMEATQRWRVRRSPASGKAVIVTYIVEQLEALPGSAPF